MNKPTIIARNNHCISRADINENALKVLYRLQKAGFQAYLVGGSVRDLLLRHAPKDFDIATDATPEQIKKTFRNCRLIGRRFRLAHILFGREIIEVATFRAGNPKQKANESGMVMRDNVYGNIEEDAFRRDFTINALLYNIENFSILDYTGGMKDLEKKKIRILGDASTRYQEDPVRILRAIRFAAKLDFKLATDTEKPIDSHRELLQHIAPARLFEEAQKCFLLGYGLKVFEKLVSHKLLQHLFPQTAECLNNHSNSKALLQQTLENTDQRIQEGKPTTPAFLFAAFLWQPLQNKTQQLQDQGMPLHPALEKAMEKIINQQTQVISIPRRFTAAMREIWALQYRLPHRTPKRSFRMLTHRRFRAAYDFLLIRAAIGEESQDLADWWTDFQFADKAKQNEMLRNLKNQRKKK